MTITLKIKRNILTVLLLSALLLIFNIVKNIPEVINAYINYVSYPLETYIGAACGLLPFSVAEVIYTVFGIFIIWYIVSAVYKIVREKQQKEQLILQKILGVIVIALAVAVGFTALWGVNYYGETFEQKAGIEVKPVSVEQLTEVTQLFADKLNEAAQDVARDENGVCASNINDMIKQSKDLYTPLEEQYPFLKTIHRAAKPMLYSQLMSEINYTGVYFPFTGEANVNVAQPVAYIGATIAHEQAHLRSIAPEQTANFLAVLACEASNNPDFLYSGRILAYTHLTNALQSADFEAWQQVASSICDEANVDLTVNSEYWKQYETYAASAANTVYEGFLQSYGQESGLKSYGEVVDLLVAFYAE